jgi:transposase
MVKVKKIVGIDVSKLTIDVYDGQKSYQFKNNVVGFKQLRKQTSGHYVMEATGSYHIQLASYLFESDCMVSVVNPLIIKRFSQMRLLRAKTDKSDAKMIYEYGQVDELKQWEVPQAYIVEIKQVFTAIDLMLKHRLGYKNQIDAFTQMKIKSDQVFKGLKNHVEILNSAIKELEEEAESLVLENVSVLYQKLKTIPSIGPKSAIMLIAITNEFKNFENSKQLSSYIGISPRVYQSGTSVNGKGRICKMGMGQMRKILYMGSLTAIRHNLSCKEMYNRLVEKGKPKKVALVAVMNKLIKQAFAIGTKLENYVEPELNLESKLN